MAIIHHKHDRNFVILPNALIQDTRLSIKDIGLLCYMLSLPDQWEFSIAGLEGALGKDGRRTISASIQRLEAAGYIRRTILRDRTGIICGHFWEVSDTPEFVDSNDPPEARNAHADNVNADNAHAENVTQIKNISNKEHKEERTHTAPVSFSSPDLDEVRSYCAERRSSVDPDYFFDYYSANGWIQGKGKPIRDWKACLRTWERNGISPPEEDNGSEPRWVSTGVDEDGNPSGYWEGV